MCVQESRSNDSRAKHIGKGFIMFYHNVDRRRNGVGGILKDEYAKNVAEVNIVLDCIMSVKLHIEGVMMK